jgi:allophanate hydrolase
MDFPQLNMTIAALHAGYRSGAFTPAERVEALLAKCEATAEHNIWITRLSRAQLQPYLEALEGHSPDTLPLYGVPFAIKDNIDLAGIPTTAACAEFAYVPSDDAFVVAQLLKAGAIPLGKTNLDQFATGLVGVRSPWGACRNSFDPEYLSGGSSAGSAVAVALGLVTFALGTDTAGSGRIPAAFNNIVGLKPSKGLLSTRGVVPACRSLDCVSIFATTTDDAAQVFEMAAQFDAQDAFARPNHATNRRNYGVPAKAAFRFAIPQDDQLQFFGNVGAQACFAAAVETLESLGGECQRVDFTPFLQAATLLYEGPWVAERRIATTGVDPAAMLPVIREILASQVEAKAEDLFRAQYQLQTYYQQVQPMLAHFDCLLTPTAGTLYSIAEVEADPIRLNSHLGYYTNFMNLLDCAAVAMPAGFMAKGLPFGVTLFSRAFSDARLLSLANRWQQALQLPLGATGQALPLSSGKAAGVDDRIEVVVCGAHLQGLPLNWQLTERGGELVATTHSAACYRLYALAGGPPFRPGMVRDEVNGMAIEVEIWRLPTAQFGSFVAGIPAPLGIGKVELADGRWYSGFICEPYALASATDITHLGSWRAYLGSIAARA